MINKTSKFLLFSVIILQCILTVSCYPFKNEASESADSSRTSVKKVSVTSDSIEDTTVKETACPKSENAEKQIPLIGHRGYSGKYPESTLDAFSGAFKGGFDGIECDVWETNSGDILVHHDSTTERMTGKNEYIWRLTEKTRTRYPIIKGKNSDNVKSKKLVIPTLEEVARITAENHGYIFIHIKFDKKYYLREIGQNKILEILHKYNLEDKALIFGVKEYVKPFIGKGFKTGIYANPKSKSDLKSMARWCKKNGANAVIFANMEKLRLYKNGNALKKYLKNMGLEFGLYRTNSKKAYDYLCDIDADFSMSDNFVK